MVFNTNKLSSLQEPEIFQFVPFFCVFKKERVFAKSYPSLLPNSRCSSSHLLPDPCMFADILYSIRTSGKVFEDREVEEGCNTASGLNVL